MRLTVFVSLSLPRHARLKEPRARENLVSPAKFVSEPLNEARLGDEKADSGREGRGR